MIDQVAATDLPPRLARLAELIGLSATLRLVEARGGTRVYVPERATGDHWLARLVGLPALTLLVEHYQNESLELDRGAAAVRAARDRRMAGEHAEGASTASLALQYGLTQRQVFNILARVEGGDDSQPDLFARTAD